MFMFLGYDDFKENQAFMQVNTHLQKFIQIC